MTTDSDRLKAGTARTDEELRRCGVEGCEPAYSGFRSLGRKAAVARNNAVLEKVMGKQPFDGRYEWMGDHPEDIGGRDPDVHQVALGLHGMIREAYPINDVPAEVARLLHDCESSCRLAEERVKLLIEMVSDDLKPETAGEQYHRLPGSETERRRTEAKLAASCVSEKPPAGKAGNCPMCGAPLDSIKRSEHCRFLSLPCGCTRDYLT